MEAVLSRKPLCSARFASMVVAMGVGLVACRDTTSSHGIDPLVSDDVQHEVERHDGSNAPRSNAEATSTGDNGPGFTLPSSSASTSIGTVLEGRLEGGVPVPLNGPGFRHNPNKRPERRYGTVELVGGLVRAAAIVHGTLPGGELTINDLAAELGGDIPNHASHRSGRDVDVLFYLLDEHGNPRPGHAIPLDPEGGGTDYNDLTDPSDDKHVRLDVARTWKFVETLVLDPDAHVQRIFLAEHLRTLLLAHAHGSDAPKQAITRFGHLTCQPGFPHDDHMHVRVFCSPEDIRAGCVDGRPIYPWHEQYLVDEGVKAVVSDVRETPRPKLTSHAEARAKAGPMHPSVEAFLERRKAWLKQPHPGRTYCR